MSIRSKWREYVSPTGSCQVFVATIRKYVKGCLTPATGVRFSAEPSPTNGQIIAMQSLVWLIDTVIHLYIWCLIISAVLSWLVAFNVVNTQNRIVYTIGDFLYRVTEPALGPIRRFLPNLGGIDLSPIVLILLLLFARNLLREFTGL
jgi:YggT family protein